jgi:hypothetical protein
MIKKLLFLLVAGTCSVFTMNAQNLLAGANEGFEGINGAATGASPYHWWGFYNNTPSSATLTDETTIVHGGSHAAKVVVGTAAQPWEPQLANGNTLTLTEGNYYTVTFWIRGTTGGGAIQASDNGANAYGPNLTVTTSWQQYTQTFKATTAEVSYQLWIHLGGTVDTYYVDDASVVDDGTLTTREFASNAISFYPNPVTSDLNISSATEIKSISVIDLNGKTVKTLKSAENIKSVNMSDLSQGMYILSTDTNQQFKFLKK